MPTPYSVTRFKNNWVASLLLRRPNARGRRAKRSSRQEVLTVRPRTSDTARAADVHADSAAACDYSAAADMKASRLRELGAARHAEWLASVQFTRRCVQVVCSEVLIASACKRSSHMGATRWRSQSPLTVASLKCGQTTRYIRPTITTTC